MSGISKMNSQKCKDCFKVSWCMLTPAMSEKCDGPFKTLEEQIESARKEVLENKKSRLKQ